MRTIEIKTEQLIKNVGRIVPFGYQPRKDSNEHVFEMYMWGEIPILICSQYTQEEFEKMNG